MCFWFEGKFVHKYLLNFRKLNCVTEDMLNCSFPQVSSFLFFFSLSSLHLNCPAKCLFDHYFAILTYVISPRTFMKLSSEANCFLFIQTFFLTWLQDSDNFIVVSWSCALCVLPLHSSVRFSSELCVILFVSIFIAIFYNILFTRNFDSSSTSCLPADWFIDIDWYMLLFAAVRNVELC